MRLLKEQSDAEWKAMEAELHSSDEEIAEQQENMAWWDWHDKDNYFTLTTKYKNIYGKGEQIYHCYGRATNRYLLNNYGFCLPTNKYNSLTFRVWLDFSDPENPGTDRI